MYVCPKIMLTHLLSATQISDGDSVRVTLQTIATQDIASRLEVREIEIETTSEVIQLLALLHQWWQYNAGGEKPSTSTETTWYVSSLNLRRIKLTGSSSIGSLSTKCCKEKRIQSYGLVTTWQRTRKRCWTYLIVYSNAKSWILEHFTLRRLNLV